MEKNGSLLPELAGAAGIVEIIDAVYRLQIQRHSNLSEHSTLQQQEIKLVRCVKSLINMLICQSRAKFIFTSPKRTGATVLRYQKWPVLVF